MKTMKTLLDYFINAGIDTGYILNRTNVSMEDLEKEVTQEEYDAFAEYHGTTISSSICDALLDAYTDTQANRKELEMELLCGEGLYYTPSKDEPMPLPTEEDFTRLEREAEANLKRSGGLTSVHQEGYVIDRPVRCKFYLKDGDRLNKLDITFHMELDSVDPRKLTMDQVTENINAELRARTKSKLKISPYCVVVLSGYCLGEVVGSRVWYRTKLDEETGEITKVKPGIEEWKGGLENWSDGIMVHAPFDGYEKSTYRVIEEEINNEIVYGGRPIDLNLNAYLELGGTMLTEGELYIHRHLIIRRYEEDGPMWKEREAQINLERPLNMGWLEKRREENRLIEEIAKGFQTEVVERIKAAKKYGYIRSLIDDSVADLLFIVQNSGLKHTFIARGLMSQFRKPLWDAVEESEWKKGWIDYEAAYQRVWDAVSSIIKGDKATMVLYGNTNIDVKDILPALAHAATGRGQKFSYKVYRALVALKAA